MPASPELNAEPIPEEFTASRMRRSVAIVVAIVVVVIALVVLLPGLASLRERFEGGEPAWLVLAVVLQVLSCASYVIAFRTVFCRKMSWRTSTEIGLAELAANSVLSVGGAGGLALGAWILRRGGVSGGHIARRTVAFFLLTSLVNVSCLALGGLGLLTGVLSSDASLVLCLVPLLAGVAAIALALAAGPLTGALARRSGWPRLKTTLSTLSEGVNEALVLLKTRQPELLIGTAGYMLLDVAVLAACFAAFGTELPTFGVLLVAYILGQLGGLIPVPGGLGGTDGGLIGGLVLYGVDAADAAVAVIAYRGVLLAVPALMGFPALAILRRRLREERHDIAACAPGDQVEVIGRGTVRKPVPT
ncbi:MAG: flippase-like domain-containing protein [Candidatus Limnocylindria bacterium]